MWKSPAAAFDREELFAETQMGFSPNESEGEA